jgi:hypothetical protein
VLHRSPTLGGYQAHFSSAVARERSVKAFILVCTDFVLAFFIPYNLVSLVRYTPSCLGCKFSFTFLLVFAFLLISETPKKYCSYFLWRVFLEPLCKILNLLWIRLLSTTHVMKGNMYKA